MAVGFALALVMNARRKNWGFVVALAYAIFETYYKARYGFHSWAKTQLVGDLPVEAVKQAMQMRLTVLAAALLGAAVLVLIPYLARHSNGRRLQVLGSLLVLLLVALELISLHSVDRIMYTPIGLFMTSAIGYFLAAAIMAAGAAAEPARNPPRT